MKDKNESSINEILKRIEPYLPKPHKEKKKKPARWQNVGAVLPMGNPR